ncbi:hypothetical protein Baya_16518 [Bagarius yarrelli]|uniref:Uncharacterized protein n=1 Tax=Bagarius yarrelli TaxID=175774 RepID=A0A556VVT6_BAGYA|nr:hypothetical protein Baya_16518 [Bagarius yarrelli]
MPVFHTKTIESILEPVAGGPSRSLTWWIMHEEGEVGREGDPGPVRSGGRGTGCSSVTWSGSVQRELQLFFLLLSVFFCSYRRA